MQYLSRALVTGGLVILTGPFCLLASGQTYVDVEAERAAAASGSASPEASATASSAATPATDPYAVKPAQSYPATSYGVGAAPAAAPVASPGGPAGQTGQNLGNLFYQIQQLQQEVMRLNGKVEEQAHELRKLKEQSLQRYVDLDRRVSGAGAVPAPAAAAAGASAAASGISETVASPTAATSGAAEQPGEAEAYRAAYALVRGQQFTSAVAAFKQFLQDYPEGKYAPNAHYWLGELYLVTEPQDLESSRQSFVLLLDEYPDNSKAPDAMYKLGKVYFLKGNRDRAREYMDRVIRDYGSSNSSAVKLAQDFIAENY